MSLLINPHKQLRHVVADRLRQDILAGALKPGEWLRQERLAHDYGVSQMPVREALKDLAAEGLVEHVPYRGVRVVEFTLEDVADLYASRSFLEGLAARAAAHAITAEELDELRTLHQHMSAAQSPEQLANYRELNRRFHQVVIHASRRAYLIRLLGQIWAAFPTMLLGNFAATAHTPLPERDEADTAEHAAIVHALETGNPDSAEQAMREHIQHAGHKLMRALTSQG